MLTGVLSFSVVPFMAWPFFQAYVSNDFRYMLVGLGAIGVGYGVQQLKQLMPRVSPFLRPVGAHNCGLLNNGGRSGGEPAFPSGHSAVAAYLATVAVAGGDSGFAELLAAVYVCAVAYSRIKRKCHNLVQVSAGVMVGVVCGGLVSVLLLQEF